MTSARPLGPISRLAALLGTLVALLAASLVTAVPAGASGVPYGQPIIKVVSSSNRFDDWRTCKAWKASPTRSSASCGGSYSVSNAVFGSLGVSAGKLSAELGFNVTKTTQRTHNYTAHFGKNKRGRIQYRNAFKRYVVSKTITHCSVSGYNCHTHKSYGTVWKFRGFDQNRVFINGKLR